MSNFPTKITNGTGPVTFEDCPVEHNDFSKDSGVFTSRESGTYSFSFTSLMKSQDNSQVKVKMMMKNADGRVST